MAQNKTVKFEIGLIVIGVLLVAAFLGSSYLLSLKTQKSNLANFQSVVSENIEIRQLLIQMSNNIRDRMLLVHDINYSSDAFDIDDLTQSYRAVAENFMVARERLFILALSPQIKTKLEVLSASLAKGKIKLDMLVDAKNNDNESSIDEGIQQARNINIIVLAEIEVLLQEQLAIAVKKLNKVRVSNEESNAQIKVINIIAFILSFFVILYIIRSLLGKQKQLNLAMTQLANYNDNLEHLVEQRTQELLHLQADHARIQAEINISRTMQELILPPKSETDRVSALDIATLVEPAEEMGGDYIDVLPFAKGYLLSIGDVTDHGLESSVLMLMVQSMIRHQSNIGDINLKKALGDLNLSLFQNIERMKSSRNLSLSLMHYDNNTITVTGQHEEIIVVRNNGELEKISTDSLGMPVGLVEDINEFIDSKTITLAAGDLILFHTDGITEAANQDEQLYGLERLYKVAVKSHRKPSEEIIHDIVADMKSFVDGKALYDDIALIAVKQN